MFNFDKKGEVTLVFSHEATDSLGNNFWYLNNDIEINIKHGKDTIFFTIEKGFLTDGTSVNRLLHTFIPVWDKNTDGVVVHDWLCNNPVVVLNGSIVSLTRQRIDEIFLELMAHNGVSKIRRTLMYIAIRTYVALGFKIQPDILARKLALEELIRDRLPNCKCE